MAPECAAGGRTAMDCGNLMAHIRTWLLAVALAFGHIAQAPAGVPETPRLRVIGVEDGLPSSIVNALAFDRAGYLWLATEDGVARYDGVGVRVWRHVPGDTDSLPGNYVTTLHIDPRGRVWAAIEGHGLSVLDPARRHWKHYRMATHPGMGSDDVWALAAHRDALWFGTFGGGLHRMERDGRIVRHVSQSGNPRSLPADTVLSLGVDDAGQLWVGTMAGLARWTGRDFERVALPGPQAGATVYSLTPDHGRLWVGTSTGLYRLEPEGRWHVPAWSAMFARPNAVLSLASDRDGRYWLASQRRLWRAVPGGVPYPVAIGEHGPLRPIQQLLRQSDGALWMPVSGAGLGYLRADWYRLAVFARGEDGLSDDLYRAAWPARAGGVWLAGDRGRIERLASDGSVERLPEPAQVRLDGRRPSAIAEDDAGGLWLGALRTVLHVDPAGHLREWTSESPHDPALRGLANLAVIAPDGSIWLSFAGAGLQQRDARTGQVLANIPSGVGQGLGDGHIDALGFDRAGVLWVAGDHGLSRWNAARRRFEPVPGIDANGRVFGFAFADRRDELWLQRLAGLEHYRLVRGHWQQVERAGHAEGIPAIEGCGLVIDARGRVWFASRRGLFRWDPRRRHLRQFGIGDGLESQEFGNRSLVLGRDGVLTGLLVDGSVVRLDTQADDLQSASPVLRVDTVEMRRAGTWQPLPDPERPVLAPDARELRIVLRLLAYHNPRAHRYQTRLEGYDREWVVHTGPDPGERVFAGLSPGTYSLHARAIDASGALVELQPLRVVVRAPWWRTGWAWAMWAALLSLLAWILARTYRASLRRRERWRQAQHEREVAREASLAKTRFLATLGHEVRTPMTGVLGMSELLLDTPLTPRQRDYADAIRGAGEHLLRLVNDALDLARIEAGRLELADEPFDLRALIDEVARLMGPLVRRRGLQFHCDVASQVPHGVRGDAVRVRQILLNLLGNALKFTERGHVALRVDSLPDALRFAISDTGPGLGEAQRERLFRRFEQGFDARTATRYGGSGLGLAICQELAAAMGGRIGVDSEPGRGTRFEVDLPFAIAPFSGPADSASVELPRLRVLLVEDDATVAEVVTGLLRAQGHAVTHVGHGLAALAEIATATFDIALLDLDLPGMDGIALARHLRSLGFDLPLVALTARADAEAEVASIGAGFDRFMRKPVTGAMLAALLKECCDGTV